MHGDGAVGVGERDHVVERGKKTGENHDERDAPTRLFGEGVRGLGKGIDVVAGVIGHFLARGAEGGDDDRCRA